MLRASLITALAAALTACGGGSGGSSGSTNQPPTSTPPAPSATVAGAIQKGPFIVGSTVTINALTNDGSNTASTVTTQTTNNFGDFSFTQPTGTKVQISATGFYRNEITGTVSSSSITLRSVYSVTSASSQNAYVNVLTHLTSGRVLELMKQGIAPEAAMNSAESEFLQQFSSVVPASGQNRFNSISIYSNGGASGSAYLLAVSAIIYQHAMDSALANATNADAELSVFLNEFSADFAKDGVVNTSLSDLRAAIPRIDPDAVMANVAAWIGSQPNYATVDIDQYLDTDLDGVFNDVDADDDSDGVADANDPAPYSKDFVVADSVATTDEDVPVSLDLSANSVNEHPTVVQILTPPSHGSLSGQYPTVSYQPAPNFGGIDFFEYRLVQGPVASASVRVTVTVQSVGDGLVITGVPPTSVTAGSAYSFTPTLLNIDNASVTFSGTNIPFWASVDSGTGTLSGTPTNANGGTYSGISITATSSTGPVTLGPFTIQVATNPWKALADLPTAVHSPALASDNGSIYAVGGFRPSGQVTPQRYDIASDTWHAVTQMNTARHQGATAHVLGGKLYVVGGEWTDEMASVEAYTIATDTWSAASALSTSRSFHASCVHNGMIYAFGGFSQDGNPSTTHTLSVASVERYDPALNTWVSRNPMPEANWGMACTTVNDRIYVFGGAENAGGYRVYNPLTDIWESSGTMPVERRYGFGAAVSGNEILLFGGTNNAGVNVQAVSTLDSSTSTWKIVSALPDVRARFGTATWNDKVYLMGGTALINSGTTLLSETSEVWEYDPALDTP